MPHTHPANRSLLFSSQPSSDIPQYGTAHPGSKTARFRGGTVQGAAEISGTARTIQPATVGTVKYPIIPISIKIMYMLLELSIE